MDDPDRFRAHAERCRKIANICANPRDKEVWLKLAADWLVLADPREGHHDRPERPDQHGKACAELPGACSHSAGIAAISPATSSIASFDVEANSMK